MVMKTLILNAAQIAFMQNEVIAWLSMQEGDDQFASFPLDITPNSLRLTADMLNLLAQTKEKPEAGLFTLSEDTAYDLNCYVEEGEERAADPSENISWADMQNYIAQLEAQPINPEKMTIIRKELTADYCDCMASDRVFRSYIAESYVAHLSDDEVIEEWRGGMLHETSDVDLEE